MLGYFLTVEFSGFPINMQRSNSLTSRMLHASKNSTQNIFQLVDSSSSRFRDHDCSCVAFRPTSSHCWRFLIHWSRTCASLIICGLTCYSLGASDFLAVSTAKVDRGFGMPLSCSCRLPTLVKMVAGCCSKSLKVDIIERLMVYGN